MKINPNLLLENYSTSETKTTMLWTDNKPIYRRVFTGTTNSSINAWKKIADLTCDVITKRYGWFITGNDCYSLEYCFGSEAMTLYSNQTGIYEKHNYNYANNRNYVLIVEYTKQ